MPQYVPKQLRYIVIATDCLLIFPCYTRCVSVARPQLANIFKQLGTAGSSRINFSPCG